MFFISDDTCMITIPSSAICLVFRFSDVGRKYGITVLRKSISTTFKSITAIFTLYLTTHRNLHQI